MNYGDPINPPQGRAQVPGSPPSGRASVGRASGSASVPGEPVTGRASVSSPGGVTGRATVGRASVRASVPVGGGPEPDILESGPGVPHTGGGSGPKPPRSAGARAKRRRRRNLIIVGIAAFIMLTGVGMVTGTYYFDQVELPQDLHMKEATTIFYNDGKTKMAQIGEENRTMITIKDVPEWVQHAVVATEDNTFYTNTGVDYKGIARAAWNNVTGGERQGASTISQQYARHWAELSGVTYGRKVREAVIAMKLNQKFSKPQIMEMYLNIVYFGRHAYGIEAASVAYFNKSVSKLTMAEGMVLVGLIKNPEGNGKGSPFDPTVDKQQAMDRFNNYIKPNMLKLGFMTQQEFDTMQYPTTVVPVNATNNSLLRAQWGLDKPEGLIVHHVMDELSKVKNPDGSLKFADADGNIKDGIRNGGLRIVTTVDQKLQADAVAMASGDKGSPMAGQPDNLQAALVSVEPGTGRVRAYYGGPKGGGCDYASFYNDPVLANGEGATCGAHPPGSSMKPYVLAAGLIDGYTVDSYWDGRSPIEFPKSGRGKNNPVKTAGDGTGGNGKCAGGPDHCTLWEATEQSLNTPFFALGETLGAAKVIDTAKAAGVRSMWATVQGEPLPVRKDLTTGKGSDFAPKFFSTEVAIGQYPITVLDHANGTATFAARGYAAAVHFVQEVTVDGKKKYAETIAPKRIPGFTDGISDAMNWILQKVPQHYGSRISINGRQTAGKTGTWQFQQTTKNAHAWFMGYTAPDLSKKSVNLATAVWVGNKGDEQPIIDKGKSPIIGGSLPGPVWKAFTEKAATDLKLPKISFQKLADVGTKTEGNATSPQPSVPPNDPNNPLPPNNPTPGTTNPGGGGGGQPVPRPSRSRRF